jgi:hypothetical protein
MDDADVRSTIIDVATAVLDKRLSDYGVLHNSARKPNKLNERDAWTVRKSDGRVLKFLFWLTKT